MLDELAETALGGGSRVDLMDRAEDPNRLPGEYPSPRKKKAPSSRPRTQSSSLLKISAPPDPANAEFFKESEPAPEFEMSASGVRRVYASGKYRVARVETDSQTFLTSKGYRWLGRVSDGTEMWGKGTQRIIYNPKTKTWQHRATT